MTRNLVSQLAWAFPSRVAWEKMRLKELNFQLIMIFPAYIYIKYWNNDKNENL